LPIADFLTDIAGMIFNRQSAIDNRHSKSTSQAIANCWLPIADFLTDIAGMIFNRQSAIDNRQSTIGTLNPCLRQLPIAGCQLPIGDGHRGNDFQSAIRNRQSAIQIYVSG